MILTSNQDGRQAKNKKKGMKFKKKSSPLKLVSQSQPNFSEMILGWSPFSFRGEDFFLNFIPLFSNLHNRSK
jgi:hypothetical protein